MSRGDLMSKGDLMFTQDVVRFHITEEGGLEIVGKHETIDLDKGECQRLAAWLDRGGCSPVCGWSEEP